MHKINTLTPLKFDRNTTLFMDFQTLSFFLETFFFIINIYYSEMHFLQSSLYL